MDRMEADLAERHAFMHTVSYQVSLLSLRN